MSDNIQLTLWQTDSAPRINDRVRTTRDHPTFNHFTGVIVGLKDDGRFRVMLDEGGFMAFRDFELMRLSPETEAQS
jgi:hypothetical protein